MPAKDQSAVKLDYIGKVHNAMFETGRKAHNTFLFYTILSCITLFLTSGVVSIGHQFTFVGVVVLVRPSFLLVGLAMAIAVFQFYGATLERYHERLRREMLQQYESIKLVPARVPLEKNWNAFDYPAIGTVFISALFHSVFFPQIFAPFTSGLPTLIRTKKAPRMMVVRIVAGFLASLCLIVGILGLPVAAEVLAVRAVIVHDGMSWGLFFAVLFIAAVNVTTWFMVEWPTPTTAIHDIRGLLATNQTEIDAALAEVEAAEAQKSSIATDDTVGGRIQDEHVAAGGDPRLDVEAPKNVLN